jgi:hypothetical protein
MPFRVFLDAAVAIRADHGLDRVCLRCDCDHCLTHGLWMPYPLPVLVFDLTPSVLACIAENAGLSSSGRHV